MINNKKVYPLYMPEKSKYFAIKIVCIVLALCVFGCVMVYSASYYNAFNIYNNQYHFLTKQIIGVILGAIAMYLTYKLDYHIFPKISKYILLLSFLFLVLVFIPGLGVENYGAKRWIGLPFFTIQASEIAKFGFVIFCACYLVSGRVKTSNFISYLPIIIIGGLMCLLIILEPNMSITMCVGSVMLIMLYLGGMKKKYILMLCIPALLLVPLLIILEPYRLLRLFAFIDPWASPQGEGFQLIQSLYSLGSGGLFGVGLFNSRQAYQFLPFSESDFIFSIIGEELGFVGCVCLIALFIALFWNMVKVAKRASDRLGAFLVLGIAAVFAVQVLVNLAVVTGSIPPTGVPLPFISAGSSSLIVFMSAVGIVLNVNKQSNLTEHKDIKFIFFKKIKEKA